MKKYFTFSQTFKKITVTLTMLLVFYSGYSFLIATVSPNSCNSPVVFIPDSLQANLTNVAIDINFTTNWGTTNPSYSNSISLADTNSFQYLGYVILDPADSVGSILYAYRYISTAFTPDVAGITFGDLEIDYNGQFFWDFTWTQKNCVSCPNCISRYASGLVLSQLIYNILYGNAITSYFSSYNSLSSYQQQQIATMMNWLLNNNTATITDYTELLSTCHEGNSEVPSAFCSDPGSGLHNSCHDQKRLLHLINHYNTILSGISTDDFDDFDDFYGNVLLTFLQHCVGSGGYTPFIYSTESPDGYEVGFIPLQSGLPTILSSVVFDGGNVYTAVAYSYNYSNPDSGIIYTGDGNFAYVYGFYPADQNEGDIPFPNVTISANGPITFCAGDSVRLIPIPFNFSSYLWSTGDSTVNIYVKTSGTYSVSMYDDEGCYTSPDTAITVTVNSNPVANAGKDTSICNGATVKLGGDTTASGGLPPYSLTWNPSTGLSSDTAANPLANPTTTTSYILTVTDSNTCVGLDTVVVTVNALPSAPTAPAIQSICSDTAYTFTFDSITAGAGANEIVWATHSNFDSSIIINSPVNISITVNAGYTDTIWLQSKDSTTGCVSDPNITIAATNRFPVSSFWFVQNSSLFAGDSTPVIILNSENAVSYNLISGDSIFDSKLGNGDTLILNTHSLTGNYYFNVRATDTITGCSLLLDSSILIMLRQRINPPVFYQSAHVLFAGDTNTYLATCQLSPIIYSIVSGDAIIDSFSGFVSYSDSNFVVRATVTDSLGNFTLHTDFPVSLIPPDSSGVFLNVTVSVNSAFPISTDTAVTMNSHLNSLLSLFGATDYFQRYPSANDVLLDSIYTIYATGDIKQFRDSLTTLNLFSSIRVIKFSKPALECGSPMTTNDSYPINWSNNLVEGPCAWTITTGNPDIIVGVVDLGFDLSHPDLSGQIVKSWHNPTTPIYWHGTVVAGYVAAKTNNGIGISSLGYNTRIATYTLPGNPLEGDPGPAIWQAYQDGRPIITCSWTDGLLDDDAVTHIYNANILLLGAARDATGVDQTVWPEIKSDNRAMEVIFVDESNNVAEGVSLNDWVSIAAPGGDGSDIALVPTYYYSTPYAGTSGGASIATPIVAAAAALVLSVNPCLGAGEVREILMQSANKNYTRRTDNGGTPYNQGVGSLDAYQAVLLAQTYGTHAPLTTRTIWNSSAFVLGNLTIEPGASLTITNGATITFSPGSNVIVEPGGKLTVEDGATLTSCGMWGGIIVEGNKLLPQDLSSTVMASAVSVNQGFALLSDATIENALNAVRIWNPDDGWVSTDPTSDIGETGGIVRAYGTNFIDNQRSAEFMWYRSYSGTVENPNLSYFYNCHFIVDDNYNTAYPFKAHVTMWGTYGIKFEGCSFENNDSRITVAANLCEGIGSIDASYTVQNYIGAITSIPSSFKNFHDGILVENSDPNQSVYVYNSQFTDNQSGLNLSNSNYSGVVGNTFTVGNLPNGITSDDNIVGVAFDNSSQPQMEFNSFNNNDGTGNLCSACEVIGSGFYNTCATGLYDIQCYDNKYTHIQIANLANYLNSSPGGGANGLQFLCDSNDNDPATQFDIVVGQIITSPNDGIRVNQGDPNPIGKAAANAFSSADVDNQFVNFSNTIYYSWYYTSQIPTAIYPPNSVIPVEVPRNRTCPTYDGDGCQTCYIAATQIAAENSALLTQGVTFISNNNRLISLIDGGNTNALLAEIASASDEGDGYTLWENLESISPYVSTQVLMALAPKADLLTLTMIEPIATQNADDFGYQPLADAFTPILGSAEMDSLLNHISDTTARTNLQATVGIQGAILDSMSRDIIISTKSDSMGFDHSNYRSTLANIHDIAADYMRMEDYWATGNTDSAWLIMDSVAARYAIDTVNDSSYITYKAYLNFQQCIKNAGLSISNLDSVNILSLNAIAQNGVGPAGRGARSILHFFYGYPYATHLEIPPMTDSTRAMKTSPKPATTTPAAYLNVYPNPTSDIETFAYQLPCDNAEGLLVIADMTGRTLYSGIIGSSSGTTIVDTQYWLNGSYLYRLTCAGIVVGTGKFEVFR